MKDIKNRFCRGLFFTLFFGGVLLLKSTGAICQEVTQINAKLVYELGTPSNTEWCGQNKDALIYIEKKTYPNSPPILFYETLGSQKRIKIAQNVIDSSCTKDGRWVLFSNFIESGSVVQAFSLVLNRGFIIASGTYNFSISPNGKYLLYHSIDPVHAKSLPIFRDISFELPREIGIKKIHLSDGERFIINKWLPDSSGVILFSLSQYPDKTYKIIEKSINSKNSTLSKQQTIFSSKNGYSLSNIQIDKLGNIFFFAPNKDKLYDLYKCSKNKHWACQVIKADFKNSSYIVNDKDGDDLFFMNQKNKSCVSHFKVSKKTIYPCVKTSKKIVGINSMENILYLKNKGQEKTSYAYK